MYSVALADDGVVIELSSRAQCGVFPGFWRGLALKNRRGFCVQINGTPTRRSVTAYSVLFPLSTRHKVWKDVD